MQMENVCRVCLDNSLNLTLVSRPLNEEGTTPTISELIQTFSSTKVHSDDDLPKFICSLCINLLICAYTFKRKCEETYKYLKHLNKAEKVNEINADLVGENISVHEDLEEENEKQTVFNFEPRSNSSVITSIEKEDLRSRRKSKRVKRFSCSICPKMFVYEYELKSHLHNHDEKNYFCCTCNKYYKSEKLHKKAAHRPRNFECDICAKSFPNKSKMIAHINSHTDLKARQTYPCLVVGCEKKFTSRHSLNLHGARHSNENNNLCEFCGKTFSCKYNYESHKKTMHSQQKPFKCQYCDKLFKFRSGKYYHEVTHRGGKKFICTACEKPFMTLGKLKRHMLIHSQIRNFNCKFCSKAFLRSDQQRRHETTVHFTAQVGDKLFNES